MQRLGELPNNFYMLVRYGYLGSEKECLLHNSFEVLVIEDRQTHEHQWSHYIEPGNFLMLVKFELLTADSIRLLNFREMSAEAVTPLSPSLVNPWPANFAKILRIFAANHPKELTIPILLEEAESMTSEARFKLAQELQAAGHPFKAYSLYTGIQSNELMYQAANYELGMIQFDLADHATNATIRLQHLQAAFISLTRAQNYRDASHKKNSVDASIKVLLELYSVNAYLRAENDRLAATIRQKDELAHKQHAMLIQMKQDLERQSLASPKRPGSYPPPFISSARAPNKPPTQPLPTVARNPAP